MYTPIKPTFLYIKWGFPGFLLHGLVNVMANHMTMYSKVQEIPGVFPGFTLYTVLETRGTIHMTMYGKVQEVPGVSQVLLYIEYWKRGVPFT